VPKKLVLIVIDGLTPSVFERAVETGGAPALAALAERGEYRRAASVFPSLTPTSSGTTATSGA
jgi:predicted AlkP superfamily pyrophosphatase or phosphodiesterase